MRQRRRYLFAQYRHSQHENFFFMARSRSTSRVRRNYRERSRSRSQRRRSDEHQPSRVRSDADKNVFYVPYRCLIPPECAGYLIGTGASLLKRLTEDTGAHITVIHKDASPKDLTDRIVVITGPLRSRNEALGWILERVRKYYDKDERDRDMFACLIPDIAAPMVIGSRGTVVRKIRDESGADVDVQSKSPPGMSDRGVVIKGTVRETVAAIADVNRIVQEYVEKGKLTKSHFPFCERFPGPGRSRESSTEIRRNRTDTDDMPKFDVADDYDSKLPARFVLTTEQADWLTSSAIVEKLRLIESKHNTLITVTDTDKIAAILCPHPAEGPAPEILQIEGSFRNKSQTTLEVLKFLSSDGPRSSSAPARILVPLSRSKYLVGVRGHTINAIKKASGGAMVQFADSKSPSKTSKFMLNILDITSTSSDLSPVFEAVKLILRKLDHTVAEDQSRNTSLDDHTREPFGKKSQPSDPTAEVSDILKQLPASNSTKQLVLHLSGDQIDALEPKIHQIEKEMNLGTKCLHLSGGHSLFIEGNRREILTAVWHLLDHLKSGDAHSPMERIDQDEKDDDNMVDYNEY